MLVQQNTTEALGRLCWYRRVLQEHSGGCVGTAEYYKSTDEAVLVWQTTIEALGGCCVGTAKYYRNTREAVLYSRVL